MLQGWRRQLSALLGTVEGGGEGLHDIRREVDIHGVVIDAIEKRLHSVLGKALEGSIHTGPLNLVLQRERIHEPFARRRAVASAAGHKTEEDDERERVSRSCEAPHPRDPRDRHPEAIEAQFARSGWNLLISSGRRHQTPSGD